MAEAPSAPLSRRIFVSHGKDDAWVANRIAQEIRDCGASTFLDETNIAKGDDFKKAIQLEIAKCDELVALFTPWSAQRFWVWVEIGAAWGQSKRIVAILYGVTTSELEEIGGSMANLEAINILHINKFDDYLVELRRRLTEENHG
jgi:TIR domain